MSNLHSIIERVHKLISLSRNANANEAAAAAAIANRLIDQYRLSKADLEMHAETVEPIEEDTGYIYESGRINPWKVYLIDVLVNHYGLTHWNDTDYTSGRKVTRIKVIGRKTDITIVKYMFAWLMSECQRLADLEAKGKGHVFVGSYCMGFVQGISLQLKNSRIEAQKEASTAAIVKIDARSREAQSFMYKLRPNLRTSVMRSHMQFNGNALSAGRVKGESMHLGASLNAGGTKLLSR